MSQLPVVDVNDERTWPQPVASFVATWASRLPGAYFCSSLKIPSEAEKEFEAMLDGYLIRAFHCTRLLDHERAAIVQAGMRPLSKDFLHERIRSAFEAGAIKSDDRDLFLSENAFRAGGDAHGARNRADRVCLFLSLALLNYGATGLSEYLSTWGGEALFTSIRPPERFRLRIGRPSMIVANLNLAPRDSVWLGLDLARTFVGQALKLEDRATEVQVSGPVPPESIEAIWHPGDAGYDRHTKLPRA